MERGDVAVDRVREVLKNAGRIHGSQITSLLIDEASGRWFCDSYDAERMIERLGLVPEDPSKPAPTLSQRAFIGLQYRKHPGYVPGAKTHYWLRLPLHRGSVVIASHETADQDRVRSQPSEPHDQ